MKRSMINRTIREAMAFFAERNFRLPPFAFYRKDDWEKHLDGAEEIFDLELGWDVTGFGKGDFERFGLTLFTLRNGKAGSAKYPKPYAEKIMMVRENQITLRHFHWHKREDIIEPVHAHRFYAEPGSGTAMVGEVSAVNDDANDNCFLDDAVRFDPILEDEEPEFLLAADCRRLYGGRSHA